MSEPLQIPSPQISVGAITEADLREALMGTQGNPSYAEQFGITAAPLGTNGFPPQPSIAELELQAKQAEARALDPNAYAAQSIGNVPAGYQTVDDGVNYQGELDKYKKLYGDSENEKGQLRKNQQELMEAFNGVMAQYEALQASQQTNQWGGGQVPPQSGQYGAPQYNQPYPDPFEGISDDDVIQGRQVKNLIERTIGPAIAASYQQSQAAMQRSAALEKQLMAQAKVASGITKLDEWRLLSQNPWLRSLGEGDRLNALAKLKVAENPVASLPANGTPTGTDSQNRIVNKLTYIEGSRPNVSDNSEAALEAAKARDYAIALQKPVDTGERAQALRGFAAKYGLNFGQTPSDLGR